MLRPSSMKGEQDSVELVSSYDCWYSREHATTFTIDNECTECISEDACDFKFPVGRWCNSAVWKINFEKKELSEGRSSTLTRRNRLQIMRLGRPLRLDENKNCFSDMGAHRLRYQSLAKQIHAHSTAMPCITKWAHGYGRVMVVPS